MLAIRGFLNRPKASGLQPKKADFTKSKIKAKHFAEAMRTLRR